MLQELGLPFREGDFEQGQRQVVGLHLRSALSQVLPLRDSAGLKTGFPYYAPRIRAAGAPLPGYSILTS